MDGVIGFEEFLDERQKYRVGEGKFAVVARRLGLTESALDIFGYLGRNDIGPESEGVTVGTITQFLCYLPAHTTRKLNELEGEKLITRELGKEDRRTMKIRLSKEGQREYVSVCEEFER